MPATATISRTDVNSNANTWSLEQVAGERLDVLVAVGGSACAFGERVAGPHDGGDHETGDADPDD